MIGRTRWHFTEVNSTQNVAFQLAQVGAPHGTVIRADYQSAGRGRQGKSWDAPAGSSLMFSVLLRPFQPLHQLANISILTAGVLADVFGDNISLPVHIKWPNDVLIDGRKASGILLQTRSMPDPVAVLGIGINISTPPETLPESATSLSLASESDVDSESILNSILQGLDAMMTSWQPELSSEVVAAFDGRLWKQGEMVSLLDGDRQIEGRILGIAQNGGLRLNVQGSERVVMAGEISRGPRPIAESNAD